MLKENSYLGTQLEGVRSTSQVANNFIGTGLLPVAGTLTHFSAMTTSVAHGYWQTRTDVETHGPECRLTDIRDGERGVWRGEYISRRRRGERKREKKNKKSTVEVGERAENRHLRSGKRKKKIKIGKDDRETAVLDGKCDDRVAVPLRHTHSTDYDGG